MSLLSKNDFRLKIYLSFKVWVSIYKRWFLTIFDDFNKSSTIGTYLIKNQAHILHLKVYKTLRVSCLRCLKMISDLKFIKVSKSQGQFIRDDFWQYLMILSLQRWFQRSSKLKFFWIRKNAPPLFFISHNVL